MRTGQSISTVGTAVTIAVLALSGCDLTVNAGKPDSGSGGSTGTGGNSGTGGNTSTGGNTGTGGNIGTGGGDLSALLCSGSNPCPSGQFCFNGLCAIGCQTNANCAADQYCQTDGDGLCHNKVVTTCPEVACASSQVCTMGFCSTPPQPTQCDPSQVVNGNDNCDSKSICIDPANTQAQDPKCYTFPACAEDKTCPVGTYGALCNDGLIPNKGLICITGVCKENKHCPKNWNCVRGNPNDVAGYCSNGALGAPCSMPSHCTSGNCQVLLPGAPGFCT